MCALYESVVVERQEHGLCAVDIISPCWGSGLTTMKLHETCVVSIMQDHADENAIDRANKRSFAPTNNAHISVRNFQFLC